MIVASAGGAVTDEPPWHFTQALKLAHPHLHLKREMYAYDTTVWPVVGLAFRRVVDPKTLIVWHQTISQDRHGKEPPKMAEAGCNPIVRWCIYQRTRFGRDEHLMDLVQSDGSPHPFDRRILDALKRREVPDVQAALSWADEALERPERESSKALDELTYKLTDPMRWFRRMAGGKVGDYFLGAPKDAHDKWTYTVVDKRASAQGAVGA